MAKRENIDDYVGLEFTYLKVISEGKAHVTKGGHKHRTVFCVCRCGKEKEIQFSSIKNGQIKSCGCYSAEKASERMKTVQKTHGLTSTSEYNTWCSMKKRCGQKNHKQYKHYGGRGIFVCDRWINSFENFIEDMGFKPSKEYSLDRKNNELGYSKENCRWATKKEQCRNQRTNVLITYNGETKCVSEWAEKLGVSRERLNHRVFVARWDLEKAMTYEL